MKGYGMQEVKKPLPSPPPSPFMGLAALVESRLNQIYIFFFFFCLKFSVASVHLHQSINLVLVACI